MQKKNLISGIYKITCKTTGKFYIGSSANIRVRWNAHKSLLKRGLHCCTYLQNAWSKYGEDDFAWEVIEKIKDISKLLTIEGHYIEKFESWNPEIGFNAIRTIGEIKRTPSLGGLHYNSQTKAYWLIPVQIDLATPNINTLNSIAVSKCLQQLFSDICISAECELIGFTSDIENQCFSATIDLSPKTEPSRLINTLKTISSREIKRFFPEVVKDNLWVRGYKMFTLECP